MKVMPIFALGCDFNGRIVGVNSHDKSSRDIVISYDGIKAESHHAGGRKENKEVVRES